MCFKEKIISPSPFQYKDLKVENVQSSPLFDPNNLNYGLDKESEMGYGTNILTLYQNYRNNIYNHLS